MTLARDYINTIDAVPYLYLLSSSSSQYVKCFHELTTMLTPGGLLASPTSLAPGTQQEWTFLPLTLVF